MVKVFVDTVALLRLINMDDDLHSQALQVMNDLRQQKVQLITTESIILEVADALSAPTTRQETAIFINGLQQSPLLQIQPASSELLADGFALYQRRSDKDWGLTDCTSFVVMEREQISQAFTSDHHFEQAGFIILLSTK